MKTLLPEDGDKLVNGVCPLCGSAFLIPGPRGGSGRNILCAFCRAEFCASLVQSSVLDEYCNWERQKQVYGVNPAEFPSGTLPLRHKPIYVFTEENQIRADALRFAAEIVEHTAGYSENEIADKLRKAAVTYEHLFNAERETK